MPHAAGLWYEEHGPADAPALILSSGLGGSASYWAPNLDALTVGYRVILYDHRGTARSDRALPPDLTVEHMADDLIAVMDAAGLDRAILVGHAAGACIALAVALKAPERVEGLFLINGFARPDPHFVRCFETRLALLHDSGVAAYVHAQPIFLYPADWCSWNAERLVAEEEEQLRHFQGAENVEARIRALMDFDVADRLGEIRAFTIAIAADDDVLVPTTCSNVIGEGVPHAAVHGVQWGGHACNVTNPAEFNDILLSHLAVQLEGAQ
jgi:aminoacrylate hydrolase